MKNFLHHFFSARSRFVTILACTALSLALTAKAGPPSADPPLSLRITNAPGGTLTNNHLATRANKLFVTGSFDQTLGIEIPAAAHVNVQLFAADGSLVAEGRDDIDSAHPRLSRGRHGRVPFVVTFPPELARQAALVHVTYHPTPHS
jgi:hypothetical protein